MTATATPPAAATPEGSFAPPELFSQDQLEQHAAALAASHATSSEPQRGRPLLALLDTIASELEDAYRFLAALPRGAQPVPSEDWIRDNYHVVQDQIRSIRKDLPRKYYVELPKLTAGPDAGHPRVFVIARSLVVHTAGRLDLQTIAGFVSAYQRVAPLTIGEVWAVAIMLRVALVDELRRLAGDVVAASQDREEARRWGGKFGEGAEPSAVIAESLRLARRKAGRLSAAFVVELLQWLRDQPATAAPAWQALQNALESQGDTPEAMLRLEHQREASNQLAIGNIITSMRLLSAVDWPIFFERVSVVEQILREDPAGAYASMDFPTRDRYRHSVEQLARGSKRPEQEIAQRAVSLAADARVAAPERDRTHHVGYYLISRGRFRLEQETGYPPAARERVARFLFHHPAIGYLGTIAFTIALTIASLLSYASRHGATAGELWLIAALVLLPVSELVIGLINLLVTTQVPPRQLPKIDFRNGIPPEHRTMVVVPAIVDSEAQVAALLDHLEVRFLANRDRHLHFALLTDLADAQAQTSPGDEALLAAAVRHVDRLNARYGPDRFFLFHRERRWNAAEQRWMGWERKRGKLHEFNRLLRGAADTSFAITHGDQSALTSVRYVITLDSDTQLPLEAGRALVGTLAHPLNRPRFDPHLRRVTEGYGVIQPRVAVSIVSANRTAFARVFSGHVGIDPYTTAVSDVYQDVFHEGSYVGKGIYDVDAFEAALAGRVPDNTLLSHDLFEGLFARAALCTDIHLIDDFPAHYLTFAARQHRWIRGDWQIARWLWPTVPDAAGASVRNTLPVIARWKILDNLRRSLMPPALMLLAAAGWTVLPGSWGLWTALLLLVLAFPGYTQIARSLVSRVSGVPLGEHLRAEREHILTGLRQSAMSLVVLADQAVVALDAIGRVLVRMLVTRRHLLQWVTAERAAVAPSFSAVVRRMWPGCALAAAVGVWVAGVAPVQRLLPGSVFVVLWILSPALVYRAGKPLLHRLAPLTKTQRAALRRAARPTWRFFEEMLGPADNWLIPDNYQETRADRVAHRTSPTNIGLQLLSTLAAHDFGYLCTTGVIDRLEPTFDTMLRMQRYRGHFFNWYDTRTLAALVPAYISTVDSGNLAGYLLTLRGGLLQLTETRPIVDASALEGVEDAVNLLASSLQGMSKGNAPARLDAEIAELRQTLRGRPDTLPAWGSLLADARERLSSVALVLHEIEEAQPVRKAGEEHAHAVAEAGFWLERAETAVAARHAELDRLTGWIAAVGDGVVTIPGGVPTLSELVRWCETTSAQLAGEPSRRGLVDMIQGAGREAEDLIDRADKLCAHCDDLLEEIDFNFLFDAERQLFSIGFSVTDGRLDNSYYDLLASEARLASFVAIALGRIPHEHWFKLGRPLTPSDGYRALLSWSASMFEYLMPLLVMRTHSGTLLEETCQAVVARQIEYGASRGVPWGISESAYNVQDLEGNYQYRAFGVPRLGLKRGLAEDLVVAPYATVLASSIAPGAVVRNLARLRDEGLADGPYGYYEAIDYTPERRPPDAAGGVVLQTYMAHHQGMSLLALDNVLNGAPMQDRFHGDRRIQAAELLLDERIPQLVPLENPPVEMAEHVPWARRIVIPAVRRYTTPHTLSPRSHLLSNGSYSVMVTNAGGGYSRRQQLAMTRWREDITTDEWGTFCYVRDRESGGIWSITHQPAGRDADEYEATFALDRAVFRRRDGDIETRTEIVVSPEDDVELRRVSLTNHGSRTRSLELTSYAEVVLFPPEGEIAHPAFANLFVETRIVSERDAILCARRPRAGGSPTYLFHVLSGRGRVGQQTQYETSRARFIGRGRTLADPLALAGREPLSNTTGPVLDPIVSIRQAVRLPPGGTARLAFSTGYADTEADALRLIEKYHDRRAVARALALASTHGEIELRHFGLTPDDAMLFQRFGGRILYGDPRLRSPEAVHANRRGQPELWKYGISGDLAIVLARISDDSQLGLYRDLLRAHEYLRVKGLAFDLVVVNEHATGYRQDLHDALQQILETGPERGWADKPGGIFLRRADLLPPDDQLLIRATARAVMDGTTGGLRQQLVKPQVPFEPLPRVVPRSSAAEAPDSAGPGRTSPESELTLFNGVGGFADDGREYVIPVEQARGAIAPAPWSNVVAHARFGFAATDLGPGFTWSINSHENRLTPWRNDPVRDPPGEAMFVRDEETGLYWSTTPLPAGHGRPYTVRHGQGCTTFEHSRADIESRLRIFVPPDRSVKVFELTLENRSSRRRSIGVTLYVEWVLGEHHSRTRPHVLTGRDPATGALVASNWFRQQFADRVAFLDLSGGTSRTLTGDRTEFLGRNGSLERPAALGRDRLSDRTGAALDPCGAIQVKVTLDPGATCVLIGQLGEAPDAAAVREIVTEFQAPAAAADACERARAFWDVLSGTIQVRTPEPSMDLILNRWLPYQALSCRIWGRSAFYQSSGAFGFRDQLQDVLALLFSRPDIVREQLRIAASRQFVEGDVQHWWHEPGGQGVRTRFSDDRLWLVYAALQYAGAMGDDTVWDEIAPFLEGRPLGPDEHEAYEVPAVSPQSATLYEHCVRAIAISLGTGPHDLPLMGSGDWNDGMNLVGAGGRGESVWLAWFLVSILRPFAAVAESRGEKDRANTYRTHADALVKAIEAAWDGEWYRRAYFDDGTPLGSRANTECRIDSIAQSWAVICGGGDPARARQAMESVDRHLVRPEDGLILLLTPPFDQMSPSPGYIQGYVPGVRENGGQYTHAALWTVLAFAKRGDGDHAEALFRMINPITHARTREAVERYRVEPYVVAADVYSQPPHVGRGGWTWYTGSAAWMYRVGMESILGLTLERGALRVNPCIPRGWPGFEATLRLRGAEYRVIVENPDGVNSGVRVFEVDGAPQADLLAPLASGGGVHTVRVVLGP